VICRKVQLPNPFQIGFASVFHIPTKCDADSVSDRICIFPPLPHDYELDHLRLVRLETTNMFDFFIALLDEGLGLRHGARCFLSDLSDDTVRNEGKYKLKHVRVSIFSIPRDPAKR
jgi:hypothetical protein